MRRERKKKPRQRFANFILFLYDLRMSQPCQRPTSGRGCLVDETYLEREYYTPKGRMFFVSFVD
jgi:hypothetical protein